MSTIDSGGNNPFLEATELIGKTGYIRLDGLLIDVIIKSVKQSYGKIRWLVSPIAGGGSKWVESVKIDKEAI